MKNEKRWDELKAFLGRTGDEIRRELEKLVVEIRDPEKAHRVMAGLQHLGGWAKSTAEEVASRVDEVIKRRKPSREAPTERRAASVPVVPPAAAKKKRRPPSKVRPSAAVAPAGKRSRSKKAPVKPASKRTKR